MIELFRESFLSINLPITCLLLIVVAFWLLSIVGVVGTDFLDLDFGTDIDTDALAPHSALKSITSFFYLGELPVVVVASFFVLFLWIATMLSSHYLNEQHSTWVAAAWLIPNVVLSLVLTKLVLFPMISLFESPDREITREEFYGKVGRVTTSKVTHEYGQIELEQSGPPVVLNVRSKPGESLAKGDYAKIIGYNKEHDLFLVELTKWEQQ